MSGFNPVTILDFEFRLSSFPLSGPILFVASSPVWHCSLVARRLLETSGDRHLIFLTRHREILPSDDPRIQTYYYDSTALSPSTLPAALLAILKNSGVKLALYAQTSADDIAYIEIARLLRELDVSECYAIDWNFILHSRDDLLRCQDPWRVGAHLVRTPALLAKKQLTYLYQLAKEGPGTGAVVEIGTWRGGSAIALALGCLDSGRPPVVTIDPVHQPDLETNLAQHGVRDVVRYYCMSSQEVAVNWSYFMRGHTAVRLLWIDGEHTYKSAAADTLHWRDYVEPGGMICYHDYGENFPGVVRAVYEHIILSGKFADFKRVGGLFSAMRVR
ncbi:MAG: class I SAM-dependent methyltransferase [Acidobacteria bacterium]|nr:class I SAM-dependent methyltransferase [Acidobacteriota bacterium]